MKATIESFVVKNSFDNVGQDNYLEALAEFNAMLCLINNASDREMLRTLLNNSKFKHFEYGFGGNHFWVHQRTNYENRLLIVYF